MYVVYSPVHRLYYTFQDSGYLYMCMDLAHGGELRTYIAQRRGENQDKGIQDVAMDVTETRFYLMEIIAATEYLHNQNVIHRKCLWKIL